MFIDRAEFLEFLDEAGDDIGEDVVELLGVDDNTPFLVETVFLDGWNRELHDRPRQNGLEEYEAYLIATDEDNQQSNLSVQIFISYHDEYYRDEIFITLTPDTKHSGNYALQIIRNDNLVYLRTDDQDPTTEWQINSMAEDYKYTTEDGQTAFHGETTNI